MPSLMQQLGERLSGQHGPHYWRSLEELADAADFRQRMHDALPAWAATASLDRRTFLKLLGASLAMAGLAACGRPPEDSVMSRVQAPEDNPDGDAIFYATTLCMAGAAVGVLVETHQGRPTKIEGNPLHPASAGATGPLLQAAVLDLWDPDRSPAPRYLGEPATWNAFEAQAQGWLSGHRQDGRRLRVLSGPLSSPTLQAQREAWLRQFPGSQWHVHDALGELAAQQGTQLALGAPYRCRYRLHDADVVLCLEADLLDGSPAHLPYAAAFAQRRDPDNGNGMSRWYVVEGMPSLTGAMADHRWPLASSRIGDFLLAVASQLGLAVPAPSHSAEPKQIAAVVDDLQRHRGRSLIAVGPGQPAQVHALACLLNEHLGNSGRTVLYRPAESAPDLSALCRDMHAGEVETLFLLDVNPAYDAPVDLAFAAALKKVGHSAHVGLYRDETALLCQWHLPLSHALESWSDVRSADGVASIVQPAISPLYDTRSLHECIALLSGDPLRQGLQQVRAQWRELDEPAWQEALRSGVIDAQPASSSAAVARPRSDAASFWTPSAHSGLQLLLRPDDLLHDGRYANNAWLQECPRPLSQLTWGNAAWISPALAARHGLSNGDMVRLDSQGRSLATPVWVMPGQADECISLHLGHGRRAAGRVGNAVGVDANALRTSARAWLADVALTPVAGHVELASTQSHDRMEGDAPVRSLPLAAWQDAAAQKSAAAPPSLYAEPPAGDYAWGMSVDLNSCIGCKGCTLACQAENNIPVVGAEEVRRGHHMHWIRVDRYYSGTPAGPAIFHQPVPCMHCEHAPCELVCPVGATVHDSDGLNVQVYNRCVGTRFCSNNCPYKVRRFNFLQYADLHTESLKGQRNPEVTVRNRGVMEKCTYCIQRIERAHIAADRDGRRIGDGDVVTACQAACPTQAIRFGNLRDAGSQVSASRQSPRFYLLLAELHTRPRTGYLARVRNPHPSLAGEAT